MKSLSKLHQEAISKAKNETDQNKAAALAMIEKPVEMIKAIMLKHELAVIEVMRELHESKEAAIRAERKTSQRTWVGLTNDELTDLFYNTNLGQESAVSQAIALLKERNA